MILEKEINNSIEIEPTKHQKEMFQEIKPSYVISALMPYDEKVLDKIQEECRVRPYLVMYKDECNIYAYKIYCNGFKRN